MANENMMLHESRMGFNVGEQGLNKASLVSTMLSQSKYQPAFQLHNQSLVLY